MRPLPILALALSLLAAASGARAQTPGAPSPVILPGCYTRVYDAAHLAAHPGQKVTALYAQLNKNPAEYTHRFELELTVRLRGERKTRWAVAGCSPRDAGLLCSVDEDGGQLVLTRTAAGMRLDNPHSIGVALDGKAPEEDRVDILASNPEHRTFLLKSAAAKACKK